MSYLGRRSLVPQSMPRWPHHICVYVCVCIHTYICIYWYLRVCLDGLITSVCMYVCVYIHTYVYIGISEYASMASSHLYVCVCIHTYLRIYWYLRVCLDGLVTSVCMYQSMLVLESSHQCMYVCVYVCRQYGSMEASRLKVYEYA
jgi:hypothetical protein